MLGCARCRFARAVFGWEGAILADGAHVFGRRGCCSVVALVVFRLGPVAADLVTASTAGIRARGAGGAVYEEEPFFARACPTCGEET